MSNVEKAVEWILLDRRSYEQQVLQCWSAHRGGIERQVDTKDKNIRLTCLIATHHGRHSVREVTANPNIDVIQLEYGIGCQRLPVGQFKWLDQHRLLIHSRCKGEMMRMALQALKRERRWYEYLAFIDDDVKLSLIDLYKAASSASEHGIHAFQLNYSSPEDSVWTDVLQCDSGHGWQNVPFVEIMAPVIHRMATPILRASLEGSISGFGIDYYLQPVLQKLFPELRIALWREASMSHARPIQTTGTKVFDNGLSASGEEERLRAALLCTLLILQNNRGMSLVSICRELKQQLRGNSFSPSWRPAFEAAFNTTTHRHWSWMHDEQQLHIALRQLNAIETQLQQSQSELEAIKDSKLWRATSILRKIGDHIKEVTNQRQD